MPVTKWCHTCISNYIEDHCVMGSLCDVHYCVTRSYHYMLGQHWQVQCVMFITVWCHTHIYSYIVLHHCVRAVALLLDLARSIEKGLLCDVHYCVIPINLPPTHKAWTSDWHKLWSFLVTQRMDRKVAQHAIHPHNTWISVSHQTELQVMTSACHTIHGQHNHNQTWYWCHNTWISM